MSIAADSGKWHHLLPLGLEQLACCQRTFEGRSQSRSHSAPLSPTAAALAVAFQFAPQSFADAQISGAPETIHLAGEVGGNLRRADHQQHLVVLMGGRGAPVEAACDDGLAIDHSELSWLTLRRASPALILGNA